MHFNDFLEKNMRIKYLDPLLSRQSLIPDEPDFFTAGYIQTKEDK